MKRQVYQRITNFLRIYGTPLRSFINECTNPLRIYELRIYKIRKFVVDS